MESLLPVRESGRDAQLHLSIFDHKSATIFDHYTSIIYIYIYVCIYIELFGLRLDPNVQGCSLRLPHH